jgi:sec-independent protein translocase protein TatA
MLGRWIDLVPGWQELLIILVIVMLIFGTSKVSGIGKSLGGAIRDFRDSMRGGDSEEEKPAEDSAKETGNSNE